MSERVTDLMATIDYSIRGIYVAFTLKDGSKKSVTMDLYRGHAHLVGQTFAKAEATALSAMYTSKYHNQIADWTMWTLD